MKNFKKLTSGLLAMALVFGLVACNNTDNGDDETDSSTPAVEEGNNGEEEPGGEEEPSGEVRDVELTIWTPAEDQSSESGEWIQTQAAAFQEANPNLNLTFTYGVVSEADALTEVTKDLEAAADVFMYPNDQIPDLVAGGGLAQLAGNALEQVQSTNPDTYVNSVTYNDQVVGFPFAPNTWFMYYDTSVFSEEDVQSLESMLEVGTVAFPITNSWYIQAFYLANGGTMFGEDGLDAEAGIDFGGEAGYAVTHYLIDLVNHDNFVNDVDQIGISGLADGSVNAFFSGSWDASTVQANLGDNYGAAQLPTINIDGEDKQLRSFAGSKAIGVNPQSDNMDVAIQFALFLSSEEAQLAHWELRGIVPTHVNLADSDAVTSSVAASAEINTIANTSFAQPLLPELSNWWTPAEQLGQRIANGEVTHDNAEAETDAFNELINTSIIG